MICPNCKGQKQSYIHVYYGPGKGGEFKWVPCMRCNGDGSVPDEQEQWIDEGKRIRSERLSRVPFVTQADEAKRLGIPVVEYSRMEFGEVKPYTLS